ncbi:MAG: TM2 domain-containing protein [Magnetococcales bacterium]|nr:TM2 domain-containing protein [Magnetococcales bacterium]
MVSMIFCSHCGKEIDSTVSPCPHCGSPTSAVQPNRKSQTVAAVLCLFLGGFGGHRFYLGPTWLGVAYLLLCWTGIPSLVAMVEMFIIVFTGQEAWAKKHNNGIITPTTHIAIKVLAVLIPVIMLLGIIMAILIPSLAEHAP